MQTSKHRARHVDAEQLPHAGASGERDAAGADADFEHSTVLAEVTDFADQRGDALRDQRSVAARVVVVLRGAVKYDRMGGHAGEGGGPLCATRSRHSSHS